MRRPAPPAAALLALLAAAAAVRAEEPAPRAVAVPMAALLGFETVHLPQGEHLGLAGATLLFDLGAGVGLGPAAYGAATGRRGGLFVLGVEGQGALALGGGLALAGGLFAGGGGGGAAPVGGGLMLRPAVTLRQDLGPRLQVGLSWSSVWFPDGRIRSQQPGALLAWRGDFHHLAGGLPGAAVEAGPAGGLGFDRAAFTVGEYRVAGGRRLGLAGARAERRVAGDTLGLGLEASAAATGDAAGYMEVLASASLGVAPLGAALPSWRAGLRAAAGLGGGGAVPTGGGLLGRASATTELGLGAGVTAGLELGAVRAADGPLRARHAQAWLGLELEPRRGGGPSLAGTLVETEWTAALQHHAAVARRDGPTRPLDTIGLGLARFLGDHLYLAGQAHSAFAGGAGAYSLGLVGAGAATAAGRPWRLGAELLVGAAGGGGVDAGGGAVLTGQAWAGWRTTPRSQLRLGAGAVAALRGGAASPLLALAWSHAFGMAGP